MPSYIEVASRSTDTDQYSGNAQTSDHSSRADFLKKSGFIELRLASNAEGTSVAEAVVAKLERDAETGSAKVPMNVGAEAFDFVNFVDEREDVKRNGVLREITKTCKSGDVPEFQMQVRFGLIASEASLGAFPTETVPIEASPEINFQLIVDQMMQFQEQLNTLWGNHSELYGIVISLTDILEQMKEYWLIAELHAYSTLTIPSEAA